MHWGMNWQLFVCTSTVMLRVQKQFVSLKNVIGNAQMIACLALFEMHLYVLVNHIHSWYRRKLSLLVRRCVDFKNFWCVQHNLIFRLYSCSPPPLPPSAFKLNDTLAVFGFTDAGWITRRQIFQSGELIKVTDSFERTKEGSWQLEITKHFLLQGEHFLLQGERFLTLDLLNRKSAVKTIYHGPVECLQTYSRAALRKTYIQEVSLNHRTPLTSHSVLCELCVVECVGGSEAAWIGRVEEADCSKVWTQSASHTFTRFNAPTSFNRPRNLRNRRAN